MKCILVLSENLFCSIVSDCFPEFPGFNFLCLGFSCDVEFEKVDVVLRSASFWPRITWMLRIWYPCFFCFSPCFNMQSAPFVLLLQGRSVTFVSRLVGEEKNEFYCFWTWSVVLWPEWIAVEILLGFALNWFISLFCLLVQADSSFRMWVPLWAEHLCFPLLAPSLNRVT